MKNDPVRCDACVCAMRDARPMCNVCVVRAMCNPSICACDVFISNSRLALNGKCYKDYILLCEYFKNKGMKLTSERLENLPYLSQEC